MHLGILARDQALWAEKHSASPFGIVSCMANPGSWSADEVNMDVFISQSGTRSKKVAEALRHFLPQMINAIAPFVSTADIGAGARWGTDIAAKLEQSKFGILCLTPTNLEAMWIHFEAGALAKTVENTHVCPYLVDVQATDLKGPLTQFQAKPATEQGTRELLHTINAALGEQARKTDELVEAFAMWWPKLEEALNAISPEEPAAKKRSGDDMLEELLELVRQQARIGPPASHPKLRPGERALIAVAAQLGRAVDYEEINTMKRHIRVDVGGVSDIGDVTIFYLDSPFVVRVGEVATLQLNLTGDLNAKAVELIWLN